MTKISISIIHFGELETTIKCLESLDNLNLLNIEIKVIIINNDSNIEFPDVKKKFSKFLVVTINNTENKGFSGGHNQGFRFAVKNNSDYHIVLNNDVIVDKNLVINLLKCYQKDEKIGIVSPKIYFTKGHEFHKKRYSEKELGKVIWYAGGIIDWDNLINKHKGVDEVDKGQFDEDLKTDFATGACAMLPIEVIKKVKGFDNRYFLYYEDGDMNMRIKREGYKIYYCAKAFMWHNNAGSSGSGSQLQDYYITRNRLLFGFSYAPIRTKAALFRESIKILLSGRKWQKIGVRDYYLKRLGKGSYPA
jgi:hypothetical protein